MLALQTSCSIELPIRRPGDGTLSVGHGFEDRAPLFIGSIRRLLRESAPGGVTVGASSRDRAKNHGVGRRTKGRKMATRHDAD